MSLRYEQYRSLISTREFLVELLHKKMPRSEMKERILMCLRHYPLLQESGKPIFSKDNFKEEYEIQNH